MQKQNEYDAIVVGSGITGGWAAKELCEKGLKTLVLERGRKLEHIVDYTTANTPPWEFKHRGVATHDDRDKFPVQSRVYQFNEGTKHLWINDKENPYTVPDGQSFNWFRGDHVGGKSIMWGRHVYRWSELDFEANLMDGHGVDWPVRYKDIAPWYDYVERFIGVSGQKEGFPQIPDGQFLPPFEMTCLEKHVRASIEKNWLDRSMTIGRITNLTQNHNGRNRCLSRNLCARGCPYGAYFSSQSSTLPAATATGNLTLRPNSMVESVLYDSKNDRASGVRVIDSETKEITEFKARVIFLCAGTLASTQIMLNSANTRFSNGLANSSGELGHNLMDHHGNAGATGEFELFKNKYHSPGGPQSTYIPRFTNIKDKHPDFIRGYAYQAMGRRDGWNPGNNEPAFGKEYKDSLIKPGKWRFTMFSFGETLPNHKNHVKLNKEKTNKFGLPVLHIDMKYRENEINMRKDYLASAREIIEAAGGKNIHTIDYGMVPGAVIHEMGTARMGRDPKTSVLNKWNQCHDIKNLFITDGSFMASSACQNPSLTYMAFTARAVEYCVSEMKKGNLK